MDKNDKQLLSLLQDSYFTKEEKNKIKKSKQAFDAGYLQACKQFKEQVATFDAQFVLLDWSSGTSYDDDKFLPRSFTLYTLVQRHLLQKEMQKTTSAGFTNMERVVHLFGYLQPTCSGLHLFQLWPTFTVLSCARC